MKPNDMREPPREADETARKDRQDDARIKAAMRVRGWLKLAFVTLAVNQVLTTLFAYVAQQVDPGLTALPTIIFSCATCAFVNYWLQADARRAWLNALEKGYIGSWRTGNTDGSLPIADNCPKRWLVILHFELNPDLARTL